MQVETLAIQHLFEKDVLYLYLNKRLCEYDSWNEAKIKKRSGDLFENAKKICKVPSAEKLKYLRFSSAFLGSVRVS